MADLFYIQYFDLDQRLKKQYTQKYCRYVSSNIKHVKYYFNDTNQRQPSIMNMRDVKDITHHRPMF